MKKFDNGLLNKQELMEAIGVGTSSLNNYVTSGMPVKVRGKQGRPSQYDLEDVKKWLEQNVRTHDPVDEDLTAARLRKLIAEASLVELELETERGQVVSIDEVADQLARVLGTVRSKLLSLPTKASGLVLGLQSQREIQSVLDDAVREVLEELVTDFLDAAEMA